MTSEDIKHQFIIIKRRISITDPPLGALVHTFWCCFEMTSFLLSLSRGFGISKFWRNSSLCLSFVYIIQFIPWDRVFECVCVDDGWNEEDKICKRKTLTRRVRRWCITVNNFNQETIDNIRKVLDDNIVYYAVVGRETAPSTGTHFCSVMFIFASESEWESWRKCSQTRLTAKPREPAISATASSKKNEVAKANY